MNWTAVVPLKRPRDRKSRLASALGTEERAALTERIADRVLAALLAAQLDPMVLAPAPRAGWRWQPDHGRGLNAELAAARAAVDGPFLVVHGDLPLVSAADVRALLAVAEQHGIALAPDASGKGTNAIALADARPFAFRFGAESLARHRSIEGVALCTREGLMLDVDTPADLDHAIRRGF